jgi:hypothetical protein
MIMPSFESVNWLAVVAGMVVSMAMGALWYGPMFGKTWLRMIGKTAEEIKSGPMDYAKTALASFIAMLFLNLAVVAFGSQSFVDGLIVGAFTFFGVGATQTFVYTTFEGPKESVWLLYSIYQIIVFAVMGGVFTVWV